MSWKHSGQTPPQVITVCCRKMLVGRMLAKYVLGQHLLITFNWCLLEIQSQTSVSVVLTYSIHRGCMRTQTVSDGNVCFQMYICSCEFQDGVKNKRNQPAKQAQSFWWRVLTFVTCCYIFRIGNNALCKKCNKMLWSVLFNVFMIILDFLPDLQVWFTSMNVWCLMFFFVTSRKKCEHTIGKNQNRLITVSYIRMQYIYFIIKIFEVDEPRAYYTEWSKSERER